MRNYAPAVTERDTHLREVKATALDVTERPRTASRGRDRNLTAGAIWLFVAANAGIIVWLWVLGGNMTAVHNTGDLLTRVGRLTGLLAAYLALIQVLLLARMPFLERIAPFDRLTVWHRNNGKACFGLIVAHVVFITIGYALNDRISIPREVSALLSSYPGMVAATVGTGLFILVIASSVVIARRRLPYELWYAVHLSAYAAIALAWVHQIPTGNDFIVTAHAASVYWQSLYAGTIVLLVLFRIVQPIANTLRYRIRVEDVVEEAPGVFSVRMTGRRLDRMGARAGQFFLFRFLSRGYWWEAHPFSLSAAPDGRSLRITVKALGNFTRRVHEIRPGTRVITEGPFGHFTSAARRRRRVALIAGGIGITPIRALLEDMDGDLTVIYRVVRAEDVIFREELERLAHKRSIGLHYVVGDHREPGAEYLMSPDHLREMVPDIQYREIYVCGPPVLSRIIERNVQRAGVPARFIHTDRFALS